MIVEMADQPKNPADVGNIAKRHRIRPLLVVGGLVPDPSGGVDHSAYALILTVDVDAVPGFREVIDRQRKGEEFDVVSRWGLAMDESGEQPPVALIDFYLPEFDLGIEIGIDADDYPRSILAAVRSGRVLILDPESYERLQLEEEAGAYLDSIRPFGLSPADSKPLIGVLQQRFDFPLETYEPEGGEITDGNREAVTAAFLRDARPIAGAGWSVRGDGPATIYLVDPGSAALRESGAEGETIEGRWGTMFGDDNKVALFEMVAGGRSIGRWLIPEPADGLIRVGSNGAHFVAVLASLEKDDQQAFEAQMQEAIVAWVPHVEALRRLRFARTNSTE